MHNLFRFTFFTSCALALLLLTPRLHSQTSAPATGPNDAVGALALQEDGKVVVDGVFTQFNGAATGSLLRLNADGTLDAAFRADLASPPGANLLVKPNTRLLTFGRNAAAPSQAPQTVVRYGPAGTKDPNFIVPADLDFSNVSLAVGRSTDTKTIIAIAGGSANDYRLIRIFANGAVDPAFMPVRVFYTGATTSFAGPIFAAAVQNDGKVLIGGGFTQVNAVRQPGIARLNTDGSLDTSYVPVLAPSASLPGAVGVSSIYLLPDGRSFIGGTFDQVNGTAQRNYARLNVDGSLDPTFVPDTAILSANPQLLGVQADGKPVFQLRVASFSGQPLVRLNPDGTLDTTFNATVSRGNDPQSAAVYSLAIQPDGRLLVGGNFTILDGVVRGYIARLNPDGSPDGSFIAGVGGNVPPMTPTINVAAIRPGIYEDQATPGVFLLTRAGDNNLTDLTVNYTLGGSAAPGINYQPLPEGSVIIPAGRSTVKLRVRPFDDDRKTANLSVRLTLRTNPAYNLGTQFTAKVVIVNTDR